MEHTMAKSRWLATSSMVCSMRQNRWRRTGEHFRTELRRARGVVWLITRPPEILVFRRRFPGSFPPQRAGQFANLKRGVMTDLAIEVAILGAASTVWALVPRGRRRGWLCEGSGQFALHTRPGPSTSRHNGESMPILCTPDGRPRRQEAHLRSNGTKRRCWEGGWDG